MAEGGGTDDQSKSRRVRLMCPHPPRPFQPYRGSSVAEGEMIASLPAFIMPFEESMRYYRSIFLGHMFLFRVDCAFDPYSEEQISVSVDLQVLHDQMKLLSLNEGPALLMTKYSLTDCVRLSLPYRRSKKSTSTAFSSDGNRIAWPGNSHFNVYSYLENIRRTVPETSKVMCGEFSPCAKLLALLSCDTNLIELKIIDSFTFEVVACGFYLPDYYPYSRPYNTTLEDNPAHLLWSKCGRFLGMSTYFRELIVFNVKTMIEASSMDEALITVPVTGFHEDFYNIAHPKAYDFKCLKTGTSQVTTMALGTMNDTIRLFEIREDNVSDLLQESDYPSRFSEPPHFVFVINCLRFSTAQDLLAVAMSNGVIILLNSMSLSWVTTLEPIDFRVKLPTPMPYYHGFSSLSFSCSDNFLAAGSTDGRVQIWCVRRPIAPLVDLCRTVVRSHCNMDDMLQLAAPSSIISYLRSPSF